MDKAEFPSLDEPVGLFPLPNVVLFPRATLPLQVFEPRYRTMVRDALEDHSLIAMALLRPGYEAYYYTNIAKIHPVVCVGKIREHIQVNDGRYFINLFGICRAIVREEDQDGEYRRAYLKPVHDPETIIAMDGEYAARQSFQDILSSPEFESLGGTDKCRSLVSSHAPLSEVIDIIAAGLLPADAVEVKQRLLEEVDVLQRARTLIGELRTLRQMIESHQRSQQKWPRFGSMN
jgi:uncharacterized protein